MKKVMCSALLIYNTSPTLTRDSKTITPKSLAPLIYSQTRCRCGSPSCVYMTFVCIHGESKIKCVHCSELKKGYL